MRQRVEGMGVYVLYKVRASHNDHFEVLRRDLLMKYATHEPRLIVRVVTKGCNLRCIQCYATA